MITGGNLEDSREALRLAETRGSITFTQISAKRNVFHSDIPKSFFFFRWVLLHSRLPSYPLCWVWAERRIRVPVRVDGTGVRTQREGGGHRRVWAGCVTSTVSVITNNCWFTLLFSYFTFFYAQILIGWSFAQRRLN